MERGIVEEGQVELILGDFLEYPWSEYDRIYYFSRGSYDFVSIAVKLKRELKRERIFIFRKSAWPREQSPFFGSNDAEVWILKAMGLDMKISQYPSMILTRQKDRASPWGGLHRNVSKIRRGLIKVYQTGWWAFGSEIVGRKAERLIELIDSTRRCLYISGVSFQEPVEKFYQFLIDFPQDHQWKVLAFQLLTHYPLFISSSKDSHGGFERKVELIERVKRIERGYQQKSPFTPEQMRMLLKRDLEASYSEALNAPASLFLVWPGRFYSWPWYLKKGTSYEMVQDHIGEWWKSPNEKTAASVEAAPETLALRGTIFGHFLDTDPQKGILLNRPLGVGISTKETIDSFFQTMIPFSQMPGIHPDKAVVIFPELVELLHNAGYDSFQARMRWEEFRRGVQDSIKKQKGQEKFSGLQEAL